MERHNRTIKDKLLKILTDDGDKDWVSAMDGVLFAHRTATHNSTGFSPFFLLYGRHPKLPVDVGREEMTTEKDDEEFSSEYVKKVVQVMQQVHDVALDNAHEAIKVAQTRQKKQYNARHESKLKLKPGDRVLLKNLRRADRKGGKSALPWMGPYSIGEVFDNNTCSLVSETGVLAKRQNLCNIKLFRDRQDEVDDRPTDVGDLRNVSVQIDCDESSETTGDRLATLAPASWIGWLNLSYVDKTVVETQDLLNDKVIDAAMVLMKQQFPAAQNMETPLLCQTTGFSPTSAQSVQIHFDQDRHHWVTSTSTRQRVEVADSLISNNISQSLQNQLLQKYAPFVTNGTLRVFILPVDQQVNGQDCGLHAIANAVEFLEDDGNPTARYDLTSMRQHLVSCLEIGQLTPFPKSLKKRKGKQRIIKELLVTI